MKSLNELVEDVADVGYGKSLVGDVSTGLLPSFWDVLPYFFTV